MCMVRLSEIFLFVNEFSANVDKYSFYVDHQSTEVSNDGNEDDLH